VRGGLEERAGHTQADEGGGGDGKVVVTDPMSPVTWHHHTVTEFRIYARHTQKCKRPGVSLLACLVSLLA
jgi:hypothetical protein